MKDRNFESMAQYIQVNARIDPLVTDYGQKLQGTAIFTEARNREISGRT
jgi:hypothetical protein